MNKLKMITAAFALLLGCGSLAAQTKVIAHRGFWDCEGSAQNSITALQKAAEAKVYGSEFDVLITKDGIPVVNHDADIQGFVIEESNYADIKDLKLKNGEVIPTVKAYLEEGKKYPEMQLILEIKSHKEKINEDRAVEVLVNMVTEMGLTKQVEYISFSKNICEQLVKLTPTSEIAYLTGDWTPVQVKEKGMSGIDFHYSLFYKNSEWIKEAHSIGLTVNVWTVNKEEDMRHFITQEVDFITTDKPLELQKLLTR
ncbi:MAG: glycerophosphodiester phosphodiesterase [Phocaeicola sp.]